ncbi:hypothetical protein FCMLKIFP_00050 [Pseudomonas phage Ka3]|uniref:Uncharacterized protein n=1 Tax=Pseudomonas phage KPP21 TaxID=1678082 RepID=A0A0H5B0Z1_BPK21|nr:hypothetical protein AVU12_gp031 [Pseudomonas phage KPP21]UGL60863.1 hypothetical protein [Pseudomonas phage vB_PaeS_TUMS_P6]UNI71946.1 hypothetical protein [Pseudomonas phage vB_PaeP_TUMS_P10]WQZ52400.1 hypothetical protein FCMLKIFP_00050 [Pseudomonas phage Ka3]BAR94590.1 hypothetical protein [Pseudomonas phage KPP21]
MKPGYEFHEVVYATFTKMLMDKYTKESLETQASRQRGMIWDLTWGLRVNGLPHHEWRTARKVVMEMM